MMKKFLLRSSVFVALLFATLVISPAAHAVPTLVQFDPTGNANYSILGINEFDWQSSGDLVMEQWLNGSSTGAPTLAAFFAGTASGIPGVTDPIDGVSTLSFNLHAQARLNDFLDNDGASITATGLSRDGGTNGTWEVTGTLDGVETATYFIAGGADALRFDSLSGTYQYYLDGSPESHVATGAGFNDGDVNADPFLTGSIALKLPGAESFIDGVGGSVHMVNTISSYNSDVIETDPASPNFWLIGSTFDTLLSLVSDGEATVGVGGSIGDTPYIVSYLELGGDPNNYDDGIDIADFRLKADANSEFSAVPEPATMLLLGSGLIGLAGLGRRKFKKQ